MRQRYDVVGFGAALAAIALLVWTGIAGPVFAVQWTTEAVAAAGSWAQAVLTAAAIFGAYAVAMRQVRAQREDMRLEQGRQAIGLMVLLIGDIIALQGEIQRALRARDFMMPIEPPHSLLARADKLYLLEETGHLLLQALGFLNGLKAQIATYAKAASRASDGDKARALNAIAANNKRLLELTLESLNGAASRIQNDLGAH